MRWKSSTRAWLAVSAMALFLMPLPARAWHDTGHMIVVEIAYGDLTDEARREVDRLVALLANLTPGRDHAVTASRWLDDLKRQGVETFDAWHYVNLPYAAEGFGGKAPGPAPENVVWAVRQSAATLRGEADDLVKALMLRFLLHLVADVHQPLHCANRFTAQMPSGDRGGNDFPLGGAHADLHAFWDSGAGLYPAVDGRAWRRPVRRRAQRITRQVPKRAVPRWTETDPEVWARESHDLAVRAAYDGIAEGSEPTPDYTRRAREVIGERLALAGYRLGALLNEIFSE